MSQHMIDPIYPNCHGTEYSIKMSKFVPKTDEMMIK